MATPLAARSAQGPLTAKHIGRLLPKEGTKEGGVMSGVPRRRQYRPGYGSTER